MAGRVCLVWVTSVESRVLTRPSPNWLFHFEVTLYPDTAMLLGQSSRLLRRQIVPQTSCLINMRQFLNITVRDITDYVKKIERVIL